MSDILKKHRVIGIRHTIKTIREAGLISEGITHPAEAVEELQKTKHKADAAKRHRNARKDSSVCTLIKKIEKTFGLPMGSVKLISPGNKKISNEKTVAYIKDIWGRKKQI